MVQHDCIKQIRNVLDEQWGEVITESQELIFISTTKATHHISQQQPSPS